jgi:hypothetical protein
MSVEIKIEEVKEVILRRQPPGDRWYSVDNPTLLLNSLTDALEYYYQQTGETRFYISARDGTVETVKTKTVEVEKPINRYSLYGEE